jgi:hypothetical protein
MELGKHFRWKIVRWNRVTCHGKHQQDSYTATSKFQHFTSHFKTKQLLELLRI